MTGPAQVASASSSVGASPTGSGVPETPLSVKSAGASPPQSSGKHLHINLGNQFRAGGSLPNVNNNVNCGNDAKEHSSPHPGAIHLDLKVCTVLSRNENIPTVVVAPACYLPNVSVSLHPYGPSGPSPHTTRSTEKNSSNYVHARSGFIEKISAIERANFCQADAPPGSLPYLESKIQIVTCKVQQSSVSIRFS